MDFLTVGVGASAGGLEAFETILAKLPAETSLAIVFVEHMDSARGALLSELLRRPSAMKVVVARDRVSLESGHVYVAPPDGLLRIENDQLRIEPVEGHQRPPNCIDHFLGSLADQCGASAIGVVLSGSGTDGTLGLKAIGDAGGMTIAQSDAPAKFDSMPGSAATTGVADQILDPASIADELVAYAKYWHQTQAGRNRRELMQQIEVSIGEITSLLLSQSGQHFSHYKTSTLGRHIARRMQVLRLADVDEYVGLLKRDMDESQLLFRELLIGVTSFFRDPEAFAAFDEVVLANLFDNKSGNDPIRIWVPGCASGQEAYTIAMLCRERMASMAVQPQVQIFATDIDERALQVGRQGVYPTGIAENVPSSLLEKYFTRRGKQYHVMKEIRELVLFSPHNLIGNAPFSRLDAISCRNLLVYLGPHLQKKLIPAFHYALRPGGSLLLGRSENISSHHQLFRTLDAKHRIFKRRPAAVAASVAALNLTVGKHIAVRDWQQHPPAEPDLPGVMQRILLDEFSPRAVIVDEESQIRTMSADMSKYLELAGGNFQNNLIKIARSGLRVGLRAAMAEAKKSCRRVTHGNFSLLDGDTVQQVMLTVQPMPQLDEESRLFLVVFHDVGLPVRRGGASGHGSPQPADETGLPTGNHSLPSDEETESIVDQLEQELETTRADLERSMQDMEAANEELKSSNEELLSMNDELQSANEEIQSASDALAKANSDLENLLRSTDIATIFLDDELCIRGFTPAATAIYGLIETDIGRPLTQLLPLTEDMPPLPSPQSLRDDSMDENNEYENTVRTLAGEIYIRRVLPYRTQTVDTEGVVVTFTNITQLQQRDALLQDRERQLKTITDAVPVLIAYVKTDFRYYFVNEAYARQFKRPASQIIGKPIREIVGDATFDRIKNELPKAFAGHHHEYELELDLPDGKSKILQVNCVPDQIDGIVVGAYIVATDITDQKQAVERISESRKHMQLALDASNMGAWRWDFQTDELTWDATQHQLFGTDPNVPMTGERAFAVIHPDDRERLQKVMRASAESDGNWHLDFRVVHPDQTVRWLAGRGKIVTDGDGKSVRMSGVNWDITDEIAAEEERRLGRLRLERMIDTASVGIVFSRRDGKILRCNDAFLDIIGRDRQDLDTTGLRWQELTPQNVHPAAEAVEHSNPVTQDNGNGDEESQPDLATTDRGRPHETLQTLTRCDGSPVSVLIKTQPLDDQSDEYVAFIVDLTAEEENMRQVRESEQRLRNFMDNSPTLSGVIELPDDDTDVLHILDNSAAQAYFGLPPESTLNHWAEKDLGISKDVCAQWIAHYREAERTGRSVRWSFEFPSGESRGSEQCWEVSVSHIGPGSNGRQQFCYTAIDDTQRHLALTRLSASEKRYRALTQTTAVATFWTDSDGQITVRQPLLQNIIGQDDSQLRGIGWMDAIHPDDRATFRQAWLDGIPIGRTIHGRFRLFHDGKQDYRYVELRAVAIQGDQGGVQQWVARLRDIHDQTIGERQLRERQQQLRLAIDAAGLALWEWDVTTDAIHWADNLYERSGMDRGTELGGFEQFQEMIHPDDRDRVVKAVRQSLKDTTPFRNEFRMRRADGNYRWLLSMARLMFDEDNVATKMIGVELDITDRKNSEMQLSESEAHHRLALQAANLGTWRVNEADGIAELDARLVRMLGGPAKAEKRPIEQLFDALHPADKKRVRKTIEDANLNQSSYTVEFRLNRTDGNVRWLRDTARPIIMGGRIKHWIGAVADITDQRLFEESLKEAQQIAEAANRSRGEFLANMSHEIRTPMTAILGHSDILHEELVDSENRQTIDTIRRNGKYLLQIINDILDLSKIDAGKMEMETELVQPEQLIGDLRSLMEVRAEEKKISLQFTFEGEIPKTIETDAIRLRQILLNLIGNAIKFTDTGGVEVKIRYLSSTNHMRIDVADSGIGITDKDLRNLFQPFTQADASTTRNFGGTGLGLSISRRLAIALGGNIEVQSEVGRGSRFVVTVDCGNIRHGELIRLDLNQREQNPPPIQEVRLSGRILIVDDRRDIRFLAERFVRNAGAETLSGSNGREAIEIIEQQIENGEPVDLMLIDMQMPVMDGYQATRELRARGIEIPIIALTANAMKSDRGKCIEAGCTEYTPKPLDKQTLLSLIEGLIPSSDQPG